MGKYKKFFSIFQGHAIPKREDEKAKQKNANERRGGTKGLFSQSGIPRKEAPRKHCPAYKRGLKKRGENYFRVQKTGKAARRDSLLPKATVKTRTARLFAIKNRQKTFRKHFLLKRLFQRRYGESKKHSPPPRLPRTEKFPLAPIPLSISPAG